MSFFAVVSRSRLFSAFLTGHRLCHDHNLVGERMVGHRPGSRPAPRALARDRGPGAAPAPPASPRRDGAERALTPLPQGFLLAAPPRPRRARLPGRFRASAPALAAGVGACACWPRTPCGGSPAPSGSSPTRVALQQAVPAAGGTEPEAAGLPVHALTPPCGQPRSPFGPRAPLLVTPAPIPVLTHASPKYGS